MTGVFLWLCCMIVEEYMLGCWMDECVWLECIPCGVWWPLKMAQMGWKMDFDGLMGWEKLEIVFDALQNPFGCSHTKSLQLTWWCLFVDQSCFIFSESQKYSFGFCVSWQISTFIINSWRVWKMQSLRYGIGDYLLSHMPLLSLTAWALPFGIFVQITARTEIYFLLVECQNVIFVWLFGSKCVACCTAKL